MKLNERDINKLKDQVRGEVWDQIRHFAEYQVREEVRLYIRNRTWHKTWRSIWN